MWDYFGYTKNDQGVIKIVKEYRVCTAGQRCEIKDFNARCEGKDHLDAKFVSSSILPASDRDEIVRCERERER